MKSIRTFLLVTVASTLPAAAFAAEEPAAALRRLFAEHEQWGLREEPELALRRGEQRYADRIADRSLAAIERRGAALAEFRARLHAVDRAALEPAARLDYDLFDWLISTELERRAFRPWLQPVGARWGIHQDVAQMHTYARFQSAADYEHYCERLEQVPREVAHVMELLRLGLAEGRTPPRVTLTPVPEQIRQLVAGGGLDVLRTPFARLDLVVDGPQRAALRARFDETTLPAVRGALDELGRFLSAEYIPRARTTLAACDLPDGPAFYATELRYFTTTDLAPQQIHDLGVQELARIRGDIDRVIRATDWFAATPSAAALDEDARFHAFVAQLRSAPRFYYTRPDELVSGYRALCKRIDAQLPRLFGVLPRLTYGVEPVPDYMAPQQATGYFIPGDLRNATASTFFVNTYALDERPQYEMIPLALHEAVPGHHFQSSLARERDDWPEFRRQLWIQSFGEGWALYAERLGHEMGLYADPYDHFGSLLFEAWRASRLVVDTGLHALGWSRAQAIAYMQQHTGLSDVNITSEVDRYIQWPGQATAYKVGEIRIRALRDRAERALGPRFDLRRFHDFLLREGTLPLTLLEQHVETWIAGQE